MAIMEENSESSQQPKAENVKITIDDQIQSMKKKFSQYNVKDQKAVVACNYRDPDNLCKGNEDAYTPKVVSIGPIHHGKPQLQTMERPKRIFLGWYLDRSLLSFDDMVRAAIDIEEDARMSYLERFDNISSPEFSEMIILDFIFLIEFFFKCDCDEQMMPFQSFILADILSDTMLLENQFPKQLATRLFHMLYKEDNLCYRILEYFGYALSVPLPNAHSNDWNSATDMLDFLVMCHDGKTKSTSDVEIEEWWLKKTRSATEFREAGVKFSKVVDAEFLLNVKFVNGVLEMPVIKIDIFLETRFRNMIASEQSRRDKPKRVTGYIHLLMKLIRSPKDVVLLSNLGIIEHPHHVEEDVIRIFNAAKGVVCDNSKCNFWGLYVEMHEYSKSNCHQLKGYGFKWRRMLRDDYFSSPWSVIKVIAASILLVLTVIQTAYTIKQAKQ